VAGLTVQLRGWSNSSPQNPFTNGEPAAIQQINDVLGWRRVLVPAALIGWIIDAEVAAIRKMQAAADLPGLHQ
jgi:hypothetical protein